MQSHIPSETIQAYHGARVEARQAERRDARFFATHRGDAGTLLRGDETGGIDDLLARLSGRPKRTAQDDVSETLFALALLGILADTTRKEPAPQERIDPIDANLPPLFQFWNRLNTELEAAGKPHADYKTARTAFSGGATPEGSLTFIGKDWEGLRAIPGKDLVNGRVAYNGQFREVSEQGTVWRTVHSLHGPVAFASPEAALNSAKLARAHSKKTGK